MPLPESLQALDTSIFYAINHGTANPVFDVLMVFITGKSFYPVYLVLILALLWREGRKALPCLLVLALSFAIGDSVNTRVVKPYFSRVRPCRALPDVRSLVDCGSGQSFPSTHATNNFAAALVVGYFFRRFLFFNLFLAGWISYSRVYTGVHYPFDVIGGALLGATIALTLICIYKFLWLRKSFFRKSS